MNDTLLNECLSQAYNFILMTSHTNVMGYFFDRKKQVGCDAKRKKVLSLGACPVTINFDYDTIEYISNGSQGMICFDGKDDYSLIVLVPNDELFYTLKGEY